MIRARRGARAIRSLALASASLLVGCDIEGVTPNCSDAGECFTPPGSIDPGNGSTGATGGAAGSDGDGSGGSARANENAARSAAVELP